MLFLHNLIRPEQFGFRNHEERISLYISQREICQICQRRKFKGKYLCSLSWSGFKYNTTISIRGSRVFDNCLKICSYCEEGEQSFIQLILECFSFSIYRSQSLNFINDLFIIYSDKIRTLLFLTLNIFSYFFLAEFQI